MWWVQTKMKVIHQREEGESMRQKKRWGHPLKWKTPNTLETLSLLICLLGQDPTCHFFVTPEICSLKKRSWGTFLQGVHHWPGNVCWKSRNAVKRHFLNLSMLWLFSLTYSFLFFFISRLLGKSNSHCNLFTTQDEIRGGNNWGTFTYK